MDDLKGVWPTVAKAQEQDWFNRYANRIMNTTKPATKPPLEAFDDSVLIMEMLRRGYAVAKMPAEDLAEELGK